MSYYYDGQYSRYYYDTSYLNITITYKNANNTLINSVIHTYAKTNTVYENDNNAGSGNLPNWIYWRIAATSYSSFNLAVAPVASTGYSNNWNTLSNGAGTTYGSNSSYNANGSTTGFDLYVKTTINKYTIKFDYQNIGPRANTTASVDYNYIITRPPANASGYTFKGWSLNDDGPPYTLAGTQFNMPAADKTYYAGWEPIQYIAYFTYNGGTTSIASQTIKTGVILQFPSTSQSNYILLGWNDGSTTITNSSVIYTYAINKTFTAMWQLNAFNLTYNITIATGSTTRTTSKTYNAVVVNTVPTVPATSKALGYTFNGWYDALSGGNKKIDSVGNMVNLYRMPSQNTTLYAQWIDNIVIKLSDLRDTFNTIGDSSISMGEYLTSISKPPSTRTSFKDDFKGKGPAL